MKYLIVLVFLVGCSDEPEKPQVRYDKSLCVAECVKGMTYGKEELGGSVVQDMRAICIDKFKTIECCESRHVPNYFVKCR